MRNELSIGVGRKSRLLWRVSPPMIRGLGKAAFSFQVEFEAEPPPRPYVIAANHYSHLDSVMIGGALDHPVRFLALDDLFGANRALDWLIEGYGAIPTPRDRPPVGAVRFALEALDNGESVGVFPESTRVSHWGILPPKRGAAWLATRAGVPLLPVAVIGTGKVFGLDNRLHRGPIRVVVGPAIRTGTDSRAMMSDWARWMDQQIARHPDSETAGPRLSFYDGS